MAAPAGATPTQQSVAPWYKNMNQLWEQALANWFLRTEIEILGVLPLKARNGKLQLNFVSFRRAVKRSADEEDASMVPSANKKSSPEIVPASFSNSPPARTNSGIDEEGQQQPKQQGQQQQQHGRQQQQAGVYALPSNDEILAAVAAAAAQNNQQQLQSDPTALEEAVASSTMRKRGINYDYNPYVVPAGVAGVGASNDYGVELPSGIWTDDYEPAAQAAPLNYNNYNNYNNERELQELDDYVPERHGKSSRRFNPFAAAHVCLFLSLSFCFSFPVFSSM